MREAVRSIGTAGERGGSTLTQQLAKNLFLWQGRNFVRKVLEVPLALWIDIVIPKRRQIEIYLNIVEWGPNGEFGAEAAAQRAFGKSARQLTHRRRRCSRRSLPNPVRRNARQPGPGLRRLTGIYMARAASDKLSACLRPARDVLVLRPLGIGFDHQPVGITSGPLPGAPEGPAHANSPRDRITP